MRAKISVDSNKVCIFIVLMLYFIAAFMSIQTSFAPYLLNEVSYSDGILYLCIDVVMLGVCLINRRLQINNFVLFILGLAVYQAIAILITGNYVLAMRSLAWAMLLIGFFQIMIVHPECKESYTRWLSVFVFILTIIVLANELIMRNRLVQSATNAVYWVEMGLPIAYMLKSKAKRVWWIVFIGCTVILSMKATAIIAFILPLLIASLIQSKIEKGKIRKGLLVLAFSVLAIYLLFPYVERFVYDAFGISWYDKFISSSESGGSGRLDIWTKVIELQGDSNLTEWIWGHGYGKVLILTGRWSAHNDFLEVLFDYGIVGTLLYIGIYNQLIKYALRYIKNRNASATALTISVIQMMVLSMFSHLVIYPHLLMTASLVWGYCMIDENRGVYSMNTGGT